MHKYAKHIQDYIDNIKSNILESDKYKYHVCFIIKDIVWCGTTYFKDSKQNNLIPFQIKDFFDQAIKTNGLEYLFFVVIVLVVKIYFI